MSQPTDPSDDDEWYHVGSFEPRYAKRVFKVLEARGIPFDVESDHSALSDPTRAVGFYLGTYPGGSELIIHAPRSREGEIRTVLSELFPV